MKRKTDDANGRPLELPASTDAAPLELEPGALELVGGTPTELVAFDLARAEESAKRTPAAVYLAGKSNKGTRAVFAHALDVIARALSRNRCDRDAMPWGSVRYVHAVWLRDWLAGQYEPSTVAVYLSAFRGVMREARLLQIISADDYEPLLNIRNLDVDEIAAGDPLNAGEIAAMFNTCDGSTRGVRDRAALAILRQTAARVTAVTSLDLDDYNPHTGELLFRFVKRGRQQRDRLTGGAKAAVDAWIALRGLGAAADGTRPLLCRVDKKSRVVVARLSRRALWTMNLERSQLAGIRARSNHDWRHTVATELDELGVSIRVIQEKLGHKKLSTTQRYVHVDGDALRRATEMLTVPSSRK